MKVINSKTKPTEKKDFHSNGDSLNEMIKSTHQNVRRNITIDKVDNFSKTFTMSYAKSHRRRKYYPD